ncbi:MAG: RNA polymerase sigma factor FliA [Helicobacter sp.]|nr:RNA polymerase sigma factor FliA [Helicobacter sp.]
MNIYSSHLTFLQDELVLQYLPALKAHCYRLKERIPSYIDVNDLISIATEEMIKLARRYDKSLNDSFWNFAKTRVNGALIDYLRGLDVLSRANRKLVKLIDLEITRYYNRHQNEPSDEHLAKVLEVDVDKIKEARIASDIYLVIPLDEQYSAIESQDQSIELKIEKEELIAKIHSILSTLDHRDAMIIQMYFYEEMTLAEIREVLEITESRISQIIKQVIKKIRQKVADV